MAKDAIVFACANPTPEIFPDDAKAGGARVVATGRSDYPNQINNVLAFPGIFRGAFDVRASEINEAMKLAASRALADLIPEDKLSADYIIPAAFDPAVAPAVAAAVAAAARETGVARASFLERKLGKELSAKLRFAYEPGKKCLSPVTSRIRDGLYRTENGTNQGGGRAAHPSSAWWHITKKGGKRGEAWT